MNIYNILSKINQHIPKIFFVLYFFVGLLIFNDYGLGWDDEYSRTDTGYINYNYITHNEKEALLNGNEKYHGPFFEIVLVIFEKALKLTDTSVIYKMRHLVLFITFYLSIIAFYYLARIFFNYKYAILACLFLILSPRIFAESFYNSKDILFLSFFNFSMFTYFSFLEKRNFKWALLHGIFCAFLIDIRILGILVSLLTVAYYFFLQFTEIKKAKFWFVLITYLVVGFAFMVLCWPVLWEGPFYHFQKAFVEMRKYHWDGSVLYFGKMVPGLQLPWHYLPVWICITTPILYVILFGYGFISYVLKICRHSFNDFLGSYYFNSILILFFAPLLSIIVFKSVVYDGWRHVYFVYPLLILMAVYGLQCIFEQLGKTKNVSIAISVIVILNSLAVVNWVIKNHPYQNVYFNSMSKKAIKNIGSKFELDYWGLSYRQGLEYILKRETGNEKIRIAVSNDPGETNKHILPKTLRDKIIYCIKTDSNYDYYLTNYRGEKEPDNFKVLKKIYVDNMAIMGVYSAK